MSSKNKFFLYTVLIFTPLLLSCLLSMVFYQLPALVEWDESTKLNYHIGLYDFYSNGALYLFWIFLSACACVFFKIKYRIRTSANYEELLFKLTPFISITSVILAFIAYFVVIPAKWNAFLIAFQVMPTLALILNLKKIEAEYQKLKLPGKISSTMYVLILATVIFAFPLLKGEATDIIYPLLAILYVVLTSYAQVSSKILAVLVIVTCAFFAMIGKNIVRANISSDTLNKKFTMSELLHPKIQKNIVGNKKFNNLLKNDMKRYYGAPWEHNKLRFFKEGSVNYFMLRIITRVDHLAEFSYLTKYVPTKFPYQYGKSYSPLLYFFIPRFIVPNKPSNNLGNYMGVFYGFIPSINKDTYVAFPLPSEAWVNFGMLGFILVALIFGLAVKLFWSLFDCASDNTLATLLTALVIIGMSQTEIGFSMLLANTLHLLIIYGALYFFIVLATSFRVKNAYSLVKAE